jgi:hypothetical protein
VFAIISSLDERFEELDEACVDKRNYWKEAMERRSRTGCGWTAKGRALVMWRMRQRIWSIQYGLLKVGEGGWRVASGEKATKKTNGGIIECFNE